MNRHNAKSRFLRQLISGRRPRMWLRSALVLLAMCVPPLAGAQPFVDVQGYSETLRPYAVGIVKTRHFERWTGYGIYLGGGVVITAAHVVGRFPYLTQPRVLIGTQELPATVIRLGSADDTDLALLSVDPATLPMPLALRRARICTQPLPVGQTVVVVDIKGVATSRVLPAQVVPNPLRAKYGTVIGTLPVVGQSGSGVFDPQSKCLAGIITRAVRRSLFTTSSVGPVHKVVDVARFFIPASTIASFMPPEIHF